MIAVKLSRITLDPKVIGGKPCIRGLRVTVGTIVGLIASGHSTAEILKLYPDIEEEDIAEALAYTAWRAEEVELPLALFSEQSLAHDWNRPEEEEAWSHLQPNQS
jgi:uncharacterized protein (DUF433 family)